MANETGIAWTDSTFNPWWGCSKVGPGCDFCYAEEFDRTKGGDHWGPDKTPRVMSGSNWRNPVRWQRDHAKFFDEHGHNRRVFCGSMCDVFDKNAPDGQRDRLWELIRNTPDLDWQLLTKRAPNIRKYLPPFWDDIKSHVWLGVTVENREHGLPRIDYLRQMDSAVKFLSIEPLLEDLGSLDLTGIDWAIVGGESGPYARPMDIAWVDSIMEQCERHSVARFFKQEGGRVDKGSKLLHGQVVQMFPNR